MFPIQFPICSQRAVSRRKYPVGARRYEVDLATSRYDRLRAGAACKSVYAGSIPADASNCRDAQRPRSGSAQSPYRANLSGALHSSEPIALRRVLVCSEARVTEPVDVADLKSAAARRGGSSPPARTTRSRSATARCARCLPV